MGRCSPHEGRDRHADRDVREVLELAPAAGHEPFPKMTVLTERVTDHVDEKELVPEGPALSRTQLFELGLR